MKFRRQDVAKVLYALTNPRNHTRANDVAEVLMRECAVAGQIIKDGHLHWKCVTQTVTLMDGATIPVMDSSVTLELKARAPEKFLVIDLESGAVLRGSAAGFKLINRIEGGLAKLAAGAISSMGARGTAVKAAGKARGKKAPRA